MNITIQDLKGEQRELAEAIGIEAYLKLAKIYGGTTIYVARLNYLETLERNRNIIKEYTGYNQKYICAKYKISDRTLRQILENHLKNPPGQLSLFDNEEN